MRHCFLQPAQLQQRSAAGGAFTTRRPRHARHTISTSARSDTPAAAATAATAPRQQPPRAATACTQQKHSTASSSSSSSSSNSSLPGWRQGCAAVLAASQACAALVAAHLAIADPSWAVLNSPNARIPRSAEAALRRSIPAFNPAVSKIQKTLEDITYLLRIPQRKPWGNMSSDVAAALAAFEDRGTLLAGVPSNQLPAAEKLLDDLYARLKQLELAVKTQQADFVDVRVADSLRMVSDLELLQAPGLPFSLPREYAALPHLVGRATVELRVEKGDGSLAFVDATNGGLSKEAKITLTLDGYSAPISAGNFAVNVINGLYDNRVVQASYPSVIVSGDPVKARPPIPLENLPAGTFDPLYRLPLDVQGGELPVLPLSIAGAVSMTHVPGTDAFLSGDEWFIFKFDKQQAGLSGLSFDEGTFGVYGYVTSGMDAVTKLQSGDVIRSARLVSGRDRLVVPGEEAAGAGTAAAGAVGAAGVDVVQ